MFYSKPERRSEMDISVGVVATVTALEASISPKCAAITVLFVSVGAFLCSIRFALL
ncbi:MAG: hypothetical protein KTR18_03220 [Acidiferrobacterales bacterium]|nr:hypothetical protein [Acidiferrobacterales bacterium]